MKSLKLESDLLKVSKPYGLATGDIVKNIDPNCEHYKTTGEVVAVHPNGDITYQIDNIGSTKTPFTQVTKFGDLFLKIFTHTPLPVEMSGVAARPTNLNECVVAKVNVSGKTILAKNRDRGYKADIEIIHEIINGVEVAYLHDKLTDWSEGLNEFGIGIVNASLLVDFDEKEGDLAKSKLDKGKAPKISADGLKIRTALSKKKLSEAMKSVIYFAGDDKSDVGVKGQTIIANPKYAFIIEMTSKHLPIVNQIANKDILVRTNHGIEHPGTGYTSGIKRKSSESRMEISKAALSSVKDPNKVLDVLGAQHVDDNFLNPYRRKNEHDMETTSQIMYNLDDLELHMRWDKEQSDFKGYVNRLPKGYKAKIKVFVAKTE